MGVTTWIRQLLIGLILCGTVLTADEFPFTPPANFTLRPDYIALHHPVTTNQITAQLYFDQGLTLLYAFNHDAAYWSFLKATQIDPQMAMGYWGMALAQGSNINMNAPPSREKTAYEVIQKALKLSDQVSESERDYIQALSRRYSNDPHPNSQQLAENYSRAMGDLVKKYPDDLDATVLFAETIMDLHPWRQWSLDGQPLDRTIEAVQALESVLKRDPRHLGANHYYVHVIEASGNPERALMCAERLKTLLPSAGHILHMPSHIYLLVGDYRQAVTCNEEAVAVDRRYIREYGSEGIYPIHYLSHNLYFLSRAYSMAGNFVAAKQAADDLGQLYLPHAHRMPELEYYVPTSMFVLLRFHKWKAILDLPEPPQQMQITRALWHFSRAMAFTALGDLQNATQERRIFLEDKAKISPDVVYGYNKAEKSLKIAESLLDGTLAEAQHRLSEALAFFQTAVNEQDTLLYNEPPDWFFPVRETLGGILLRNRRFEEAERVFRDDLTRHPGNGRSLFGLRECLIGQSRHHDLFWINQQFQRAWMYSDTTLTVDGL